MSGKRIIFLDIDGVLINLKSLRAGRDEEGLHRPDPECVERLNLLTDTFDAQIVVSSTWRKYGLQKITQILAGWGVAGKVIGATPDLSYIRESGIAVAPTRGDEIRAWLDVTSRGKREVGQFVILDDDRDMGDLLPYLVQIDPERGLSDDDVDKARMVIWRQQWPNTVLLGHEEFTVGYVRRLRTALCEALDKLQYLLALPGCDVCKDTLPCKIMPGQCSCTCHTAHEKRLEEAKAFVESFRGRTDAIREVS